MVSSHRLFKKTSAWFNEVCHIPDTLNLKFLNLSKIQQFQQILSNKPASAVAFGDVTSYQMSRLACDRWLPDTLLEGMTSLLDRSSQDCLCLVLSEVCKFTLNTSIASALNNRKKIRLLVLIVNVQIDAVTGPSVASIH